MSYRNMKLWAEAEDGTAPKATASCRAYTKFVSCEVPTTVTINIAVFLERV
jgi:hypothetical protein